MNLTFFLYLIYIFNPRQIAALFRYTMEISTGLNVHKTSHSLLRIIYAELNYYDFKLVLNERAMSGPLN